MSSASDKLLANVQGDIVLDGLPKRFQSFYLFTIKDNEVKNFCQALKPLAGEIANGTHTAEIRKQIAQFKKDKKDGDPDTIDTVGANIAFSFKGLEKMSKVLSGLDLQMGDTPFAVGMKGGAEGLQDPVKPGTNEPAYEAAFANPSKLHGVILVAGNTTQIVQQKLDKIKKILGATATELSTIKGKVRPGEFKGHEHFGYLDGISEPAVAGIDTDLKAGQDTIRQGMILCGREGDKSRPAWMTDGSFMCFRKLQQNVQDWDSFVVSASNSLGTWPAQLGARLIGRWKSGCPVMLQPDFDDKALGVDPARNNNFTFARGESFLCPIGAHIRKTNPRGDLGAATFEHNRILRRGIPYGEEVKDDPQGERGLLFVCYQSDIGSGFKFIQETWANNQSFLGTNAGLDATIGQTRHEDVVLMGNLFPQDTSKAQAFKGINQFVVPKGGEYLFTPSMGALRDVLCKVK